MIASIVINVGILALFKYYNFFVGSFADLFGLQNSIHSLKIVLPLGISFFTFQAIAYVVDVYKRKIEPTNFVDCLLLAYHEICGDSVVSFDKKLNKRLCQLTKTPSEHQ